MASDLRAEAVRGAGWTAAQKWAVRVSGLLVFVALSRLLGPAQIGLGALALAVTSLLSGPLELGVRSFLVRAGERDARTENTVFWITVVVSLLAMGMTCGVAMVLRDVQGASQPLWQILIALSPVVLVTAVEAVPSARLERALQFRSLAVREMVSAVCAGVVGIALAASGAGVWALVAQALVQACVSLALVVTFARWRPGFSFSRGAAGELGRFGAPLVGVQLIQLLRDRADQLIIGAFLGLDALGLWAIATRLLSAVEDLSISLLDVVAYPVFVRIHGDRQRLSRAYAVAVSTCQGVLVPTLAIVAVTAPVMVPAVFGAQWKAAVLPTQLLCLGYAIYALSYLNRPMIRSVGKAGTEFVYVLANQLAHIGVVFVVARHGLAAIAIALAAEGLVSVLAGAWLLAAKVGIESPLPRPSLVTMACGSVAAACGFATAAAQGPSSLRGAAVAGLVTIVVYGAGMFVLNRPMLVTLAEDARRLVGRAA